MVGISPRKCSVRGLGGPTFHPVPVSRGAGTDPHCITYCYVGLLCAPLLWPGPGCSLKEIAAHPAEPLTLEVQGAAPGSRMQAGGRCQGPAVQGAEPQPLSHPPRNCPCPGLSLLPPASFL